MQCSGAAASDIEVGETDTENLITDYEVAQTTDTEGDIEESTDAGRVMSKKETGTLTNTEVLRCERALHFLGTRNGRNLQRRRLE
jgi:hypothetical protein